MKILNSRLTYICDTGESTNDNHKIGLYRCSCGNIARVADSRVRTGKIKSCGCLLIEKNRAIKKHGHKVNGKCTPTYKTWQSIKRRCLCEDDKDYPRYGGRGITICHEWINSFEQFLNDVGERPQGKTIDRIDTNKGYDKNNVRWATPLEQVRNKRNSKTYNFYGKEMHMPDIAKIFGISNSAAHMRYKRGKLEGVNYVCQSENSRMAHGEISKSNSQ